MSKRTKATIVIVALAAIAFGAVGFRWFMNSQRQHTMTITAKCSKTHQAASR